MSQINDYPTAYTYSGRPIMGGAWSSNSYVLPPVPQTPRRKMGGAPESVVSPPEVFDTSLLGAPQSGGGFFGNVRGDGGGPDNGSGDGGGLLGPNIDPGQQTTGSGGALHTPSGSTLGGAIGTGIGLATGFGLAGPLGGALGTGIDVRNANNQLNTLGIDGRPVSFGPAMAANFLNPFGVFGQDGWFPGARSTDSQMADALTAQNNTNFAAGAGSGKGQYDTSYGGDYVTPTPAPTPAPDTDLGDAGGAGGGGFGPGVNGDNMGEGGWWAKGGPVRGPGTTTSDSIPAHLSNQEHVVNAADIKALGGGNYDKGHQTLDNLISAAVMKMRGKH